MVPVEVLSTAYGTNSAVLSRQSCPTVCDPMDSSPSGSSVLGDSAGKNTGVGCHSLLKGLFPTQGSNSGLPHCMRILYQLSYREALTDVSYYHLKGVEDSPSRSAAAKSLQSCPTPCDPVDGSPPGSAVPGILQARTLEWVAISFSNA